MSLDGVVNYIAKSIIEYIVTLGEDGLAVNVYIYGKEFSFQGNSTT